MYQFIINLSIYLKKKWSYFKEKLFDHFQLYYKVIIWQYSIPLYFPHLCKNIWEKFKKSLEYHLLHTIDRATVDLKIQREFEKSSRSPLATLLPQNRQWVFFKDPTAWRPDSHRVLTTSRVTATFPATTTSCRCATAQHTPHPLQRAPRAPCCRAQSCPAPKHWREDLVFKISLLISPSLQQHSSTDAWHTGHDTGEDRIPLWGLCEMDCTSKQEQIWTPAIIQHHSQKHFITSCAFKIRCKKHSLFIGLWKDF